MPRVVAEFYASFCKWHCALKHENDSNAWGKQHRFKEQEISGFVPISFSAPQVGGFTRTTAKTITREEKVHIDRGDWTLAKMPYLASAAILIWGHLKSASVRRMWIYRLIGTAGKLASILLFEIRADFPSWLQHPLVCWLKKLPVVNLCLFSVYIKTLCLYIKSEYTVFIYSVSI